jgi:hydroxypyruvate isomerase
MKRRDFVKTGLIAGTTVAAASAVPLVGRGGPGRTAPAGARGYEFQLKYAPHFGMFRHHAGDDLVDQLRFMHEVGFRALEDNGMKGRSVADQERVAREMERLGMEMGVFVAHTIPWSDSSLAIAEQDAWDAFLRELNESVEVAKRVNATWMTVVPGQYDRRLEMHYQTANIVELLKRASDILEPHGLVMVLEPLNPHRDHPGMFLSGSPQAYLICRAVGSPSCKILFDIYHQQITEGNLIPNIERSWEEIAYFQIGDNPGRKEPTTGEINYKNVFAYIHSRGYQGIMGMEHGNAHPGREGEQALIDAYAYVDGFTA